MLDEKREKTKWSHLEVLSRSELQPFMKKKVLILFSLFEQTDSFTHESMINCREIIVNIRRRGESVVLNKSPGTITGTTCSLYLKISRDVLLAGVLVPKSIF